jgi:tRNA(Arg) A34 adenosine deaminase TadA
MNDKLSDDDIKFLNHSVGISRQALRNGGKTPFGALIVIGGDVVAEGTSSVVELNDPTAHAEVMALRNAGAALQRHLFPDAVMYSSSEPCPMCLVACYWARVPRLVFGATSFDVATFGFEDLQLYRELSLPAAERSLREDQADGAERDRAAEILRQWAATVPGGVSPKY